MRKKPYKFGPHPDDAREARLAAEGGECLPIDEGYALLDEMLGETFPRPKKKR